MRWVKEILLDSLVCTACFLLMLGLGLAIALPTLGVAFASASYSFNALRAFNEPLARIICIVAGAFAGGVTLLVCIRLFFYLIKR